MIDTEQDILRRIEQLVQKSSEKATEQYEEAEIKLLPKELLILKLEELIIEVGGKEDDLIRLKDEVEMYIRAAATRGIKSMLLSIYLRHINMTIHYENEEE